MKKTFIIIATAITITGCSTTKYQTTPTLCPEVPKISLPEVPSVVNDEPAAENFLGRLLNQFGGSENVVKE